MGKVYDHGIPSRILGDRLVLGVVFSGQLQVRRGEPELALHCEVGARAVTSWRSLARFFRVRGAATRELLKALGYID